MTDDSSNAFATPPEGTTPQPSGYRPPPPTGPPGKIRPTGVTILLYLVTCGIYGLFYYYMVHEEMKRHSGQGLGGGLALIIGILAGPVLPFITSNEVGGLYEASGRPAPVSWKTALWVFPGVLLIVGPIVWFVKTNGALNEYWSAAGATQ